VIGTSSANFASGELVSEVRHRERVLNTLYYLPPANRCVEIMSCGYTDPAIIEFLTQELTEVEFRPMVIKGDGRKGLVLPRVWGALRREVLKLLSEGVVEPEEVDMLFRDFFGSKRGICEMMDRVGLDVVGSGERLFLRREIEGEGLWREKGDAYVKWLESEFIEKGRLGVKSGEGLVVKEAEIDSESESEKERPGREIWKEHAVDLSGL